MRPSKISTNQCKIWYIRSITLLFRSKKKILTMNLSSIKAHQNSTRILCTRQSTICARRCSLKFRIILWDFKIGCKTHSHIGSRLRWNKIHNGFQNLSIHLLAMYSQPQTKLKIYSNIELDKIMAVAKLLHAYSSASRFPTHKETSAKLGVYTHKRTPNLMGRSWSSTIELPRDSHNE